jgi:hypothetical protein
MKSAQLICLRRLGAGGLPKRRRMLRTCLIGNAVTQIRECSSDAIVSPTTILTSHAEDEFRDLACEGRSTRIEAVAGAVELLCDQFTKPGQDGVWLGGRGH